jgi:hypothetical protein
MFPCVFCTRRPIRRSGSSRRISYHRRASLRPMRRTAPPGKWKLRRLRRCARGSIRYRRNASRSAAGRRARRRPIGESVNVPPGRGERADREECDHVPDQECNRNLRACTEINGQRRRRAAQRDQTQDASRNGHRASNNRDRALGVEDHLICPTICATDSNDATTNTIRPPRTTAIARPGRHARIRSRLRWSSTPVIRQGGCSTCRASPFPRPTLALTAITGRASPSEAAGRRFLRLPRPRFGGNRSRTAGAIVNDARLGARCGCRSRNARRLRPTERTTLRTKSNLDPVPPVRKMSNSNSGLDALGTGHPGPESGILSDLADHPGIKMKPAFLRGIGALAFQMSRAHLLSVNKPIYDLHALDAHL